MNGGIPELPGVEHRFVDAGGLRTHVAEAGEGEPLLLLHGWPQHWWCWRDLIPALAPHYRVIAPDLRGHGWTDAPPGGYEKEQLASDVLALVDALGGGFANPNDKGHGIAKGAGEGQGGGLGRGSSRVRP